MKLIPVHPDNLNLALKDKDVEQYLVKGVEYLNGKYILEDLIASINKQDMVLWVVYNEDREKCVGCVITETYQFPRLRSLNIFLYAGMDLELCLPLLEELKIYAKGVGCTKIEFYGRNGWERKLKQYGFDNSHIVMECDLC